MNRLKGTLATILSSLIFGFTPILARMTYDGGSNSINMVFLRSFLAIPFLFLLLKKQGISLKVSKGQLRDLLLGGFIGSALTTLCLYASYRFISVGTATTLHFAYPLLVVLAGLFFFHERLQRKKIVALILGLVGVMAFFEFGGGNAQLLGFGLALFSALTFAFKVVWTERSSIANLNSVKITLYFCLCDCILAGSVGLFTGQLTFRMTGTAWFYSLLVALFVSVVAVPLLNYGICSIGASSASILSTLEPITSVVLGRILMSETLTIYKIVGCICILVSVLLVSLGRQKSTNDQ